MGKSDLVMDWATHKAAKHACQKWHYSGCLPSGKLFKVGAWEAGRFIGVVLFGRGATPNLCKPYGLKQTECVELVRIAMRDHETPVSRIVSLALRKLRGFSPGVRLVVSFADPGQNHHGGIYQAGNWIYTGQSDGGRFYMVHGRMTHPRTVIARGGENSLRGAKRMDPNAEAVMVEGKHRYVMPLDKTMQQQVQHLSKPYPKREKQAMAGTTGTATGQHRSSRSISAEVSDA